ncbi:hypothetical protein BLAT2472_20217 [Burkholderia latens]
MTNVHFLIQRSSPNIYHHKHHAINSIVFLINFSHPSKTNAPSISNRSRKAVRFFLL